MALGLGVAVLFPGGWLVVWLSWILFGCGGAVGVLFSGEGVWFDGVWKRGFGGGWPGWFGGVEFRELL